MDKGFNIGKTILIGLGFFTVAIVWSIYNVAVPEYLDKIGMSSWTLGLIMALDNIFAAVFNPLFGNLSDKTHTRFGRRMPYLLVGIPMAAILFVTIPYVRTTLFLLIPVVILMNFFMCAYRSPTVSLMPDLTPPRYRGQANGVINLMGGIGTATAMLLGSMLFDISETLPFQIAAVLMIITVIIMFRFVKEPPVAYQADEKPDDAKDARLTPGQRRSVILILIAIFCWFVAYNGMETYLTLFSIKVLGVTKGIASRMFLVVSVAFLISAIPAGYIARRLGRRRTILMGILCMGILCGFLITVRNMTMIYVLLAIAGVGWALININSYPMVVQLAGPRVGTYTGYYYFFSMLAASVSPVMVGGLMDGIRALQDRRIIGSGYVAEEILFPVGLVFFILAGVCMLFVRHGEAEEKDTPDIMQQVGQMDV